MLTELKKKNILEFSGDRLRSWLADRKIAAYRADQIQKWIYLRQADSFDVMTDISKAWDLEKFAELANRLIPLKRGGQPEEGRRGKRGRGPVPRRG